VATRVTGSRRGKALGIALGDRSLTVAEVHSGQGRYEVGRVAEFTFPAGIGLQQPEQLGAALAQFLQEQGFTAKSAVFGLPAKWVLSKHKEVPAADEGILNETLRIQAEGEFSPELKDLVFEYAGGSAGSVLLMAVPRSPPRPRRSAPRRPA
jgi:Tfp pilus assembly PilM family ATPase